MSYRYISPVFVKIYSFIEDGNGKETLNIKTNLYHRLVAREIVINLNHIVSEEPSDYSQLYDIKLSDGRTIIGGMINLPIVRS